jgi:outer membrane protein
MNANRTRTGAVLLVAMLLWRAPAWCSDLLYPFVDPLRTEPAVVKTGVILPGDTTPITCSAKKDFSLPLALGEAVDLALCNNPQIRFAWAGIKFQAGAVGEARAAYLPTLIGTVSRTNDRIRYPGSNTPSTDIAQTTFQGGVTWRIFDFGGRAANRQAAELLLTAALATHDATLQRALSSVVQAYFDAVTAKAALKAATEGTEIARGTLNSARGREEKGVIPQSDTLRAKTALARAVLDDNRAHGDYRKALAVLGSILGVPGDTVISMPEEITAETAETSKDLNRWFEEARKNHPAILAAKEQVEAARKRVVVARSAGLPTLTFLGNYYQNTRPGEPVTPTETREVTVGVALSIPLFDGFSATYKVRGAEAEVEQKEAGLADAEYRIALELIKAYADAISALQNLDASANLLEAAQEALTVSQRRYDKGAADITEILSTQSTLSDSRRERIRCLAEWHSARLRLLASAGQMGRSAATEAKTVPLAN